MYLLISVIEKQFQMIIGEIKNLVPNYVPWWIEVLDTKPLIQVS